MTSVMVRGEYKWPLQDYGGKIVEGGSDAYHRILVGTTTTVKKSLCFFLCLAWLSNELVNISFKSFFFLNFPSLN